MISFSSRYIKVSAVAGLLLAAVACAMSFSSAAAAERRVEKNLVFDEPQGLKLMGDMYTPDGDGPFPGILFIHGGGFVGGSRSSGDIERLVMYFVDNGYAVFNADYRLFRNDGIFPNNIKDAKCALGWLKTNAAKYNVDVNRIGTMGESAGAYLAAMVAMTPDDPDSRPDCAAARGADPTVKASALFYPPTDFTTFEGGFIKVMEVEIRSARKLKSKKQVEEYKRKYSPITHVSGAPPTFISYSDPDDTVPAQQGRIMTEALRNSGTVYDSLEVSGPGMNHGFVLVKPEAPQSVEAKRRALLFFDAHVKNAAAPAPSK